MNAMVTTHQTIRMRGANTAWAERFGRAPGNACTLLECDVGTQQLVDEEILG